MRVTVVGASGFIGRALAAALAGRGDEVVPASLRDPEAAIAACDGADAVVNLAGAPVAGRRWTRRVKDEIRRSRVDGTERLVAGIGGLARRPAAFVGASAVGYYGTSEEMSFVETSAPGTDFLAHQCVDWERAAQGAARHGLRVAVVRTGLVLGDGGALAKLLPPFRLGLGGIVGNGRQWCSWIHLDDVVGIYLRAIDGAGGVLNATAPNPVRNRDFTHALATQLRRPALVPVPELLLTLAFGEGATILTRGQRVFPQRTTGLGYRFRYATLDAALASLLGSIR